MGRPVQIRTHDGTIHRGIIQRVDRRNVYLSPMGRPGLGGYGYGFGGFGAVGGFGVGGFGYRPGFGAGIALGAIATLALVPFLFW